VNRINSIEADGYTIYSCSNDCTVRVWDAEMGNCLNIYKFSDPISCIDLKLESGKMVTASWDKMIRIVDLEEKQTEKSFVGSEEAIKCIHVSPPYIFVAGCDPIIRGWNLEVFFKQI
jgi:WD40 repeat protein